MASPYLQKLIHIAKHEVPALQYDLQNAGTHYALQAAAQHLFEIVGYLLHHAIKEAVAQVPLAAPAARQTPAAQTATVQAPIKPAPVVAPAPVPVHMSPIDVLDLPPPPALTQPSQVGSPTPSLPGIEAPTIQPGVANVFVTPGGTSVVSPNGARAVLPAGTAVTSELTSPQPPTPPEAPEGVDNVILPPGGGMSAEVAAAIAGRSGSAPNP